MAAKPNSEMTFFETQIFNAAKAIPQAQCVCGKKRDPASFEAWSLNAPVYGCVPYFVGPVLWITYVTCCETEPYSAVIQGPTLLQAFIRSLVAPREK